MLKGLLGTGTRSSRLDWLCSRVSLSIDNPPIVISQKMSSTVDYVKVRGVLGVLLPHLVVLSHRSRHAKPAVLQRPQEFDLRVGEIRVPDIYDEDNARLGAIMPGLMFE
mmetsp:Transcript_34213/g.46555  ORF Transcript_34213/g.46555 Transcript_34213/m.46555 type:complete len:109 (+) Transcript_34213:31-357(+)